MKTRRATIILLIAILCAACAFTCAAEGTGTPAYRTDLTEEDYIGTWRLKSMMIEGYSVPAESLNMHATIVVTSGQIEITDVFGEIKSYATTFENGRLGYINELGEQILEKTCKFIRDWEPEKAGIKWINVNLSPVQLMRLDLADRFEDLINKYEIYFFPLPRQSYRYNSLP